MPATPNPDPNAGQDNGTAPMPPPGSFEDNGWSTMLAPEAPANAAAMASVTPRPYSRSNLYSEAVQRHKDFLQAQPQAMDESTPTGPIRRIATKYGSGFARTAGAVNAERYQIGLDDTLAQLLF